VVGDADVIVAEVGRGLDVVSDSVRSVGPLRVGVQVTPDVTLLDQVREGRRRAPPGSRRDSPAVRAGPRPCRGARTSTLRCRHRSVRPPAGPRRPPLVQVADVEHPVLVHLQAGIDGDIPDGNVVLLAPREVLQRAAELLGDDDAQVDADAGGADARLRVAGLDERVCLGPVGEGVDDRLAVFAAHEARRRRRWSPSSAGASHRAPRRRRRGRRRGSGRRSRRRDGPFRATGAPASGGRTRCCRGCSARSSRRSQRPLDLTGLRCGLEVVQVHDPEFLVQRPGGLGPDALDARNGGDVHRILVAEVVQLLDLAGLDVLDDLRGDGIAHALDVVQRVLALRREGLDGPGYSRMFSAALR